MAIPPSSANQHSKILQAHQSHSSIMSNSTQHSTATQESPTWTALLEANEESSINNSQSRRSLLTSPSPMPIQSQPQPQSSVSPSSKPVKLTHSELKERSMFYIRQSTRGAFDPNAHTPTGVRTRSLIASPANPNTDADSVRSADSEDATRVEPLSIGAPLSLGSPASKTVPYVLLQPRRRSSTVERGASRHSRSLSERPKERTTDSNRAGQGDLVSVINAVVANNTDERGRSRGPTVPVGLMQVGHPSLVRDGKTGAELVSQQPTGAHTEEATTHTNARGRFMQAEQTQHAPGPVEQPLPAQMQPHGTEPQTQGTRGLTTALNSTFAQHSRPLTPSARVGHEDTERFFVDESLMEFAEGLQKTQRTTNPNIPRPPRTTNNSIIAALTANFEHSLPRSEGTLKRNRPDTDEDEDELEAHERDRRRKRAHIGGSNDTSSISMTTRARNGVFAFAPSRFQKSESTSAYLHPLDRAYPSRILDISFDPHLSTLLGYSSFTDEPDPLTSGIKSTVPRPALSLPQHQQRAEHPWSGFTTPRWSEAGEFKLRLDALFGKGSMLRGFGKRPAHEGGMEAEQPGAGGYRSRNRSARESPASMVDGTGAAGVSREMDVNARMQAMRLGVPTTPTAAGREVTSMDTDTEDAASTAAGTEDAVSEMRSRVMRRSLLVESPTRPRAG